MIIFRTAAVAVAAILATTLSACSASATRGVTIEMNELPVATTLAAGLPETLVFSDRMGAAAVALVPGPVDVDGYATLSSYESGDVAYRAAEQTLFVFLSDGAAEPGDGLILIGRTADGVAGLSSCSQDCSVRVSARHAEVSEQHDER